MPATILVVDDHPHYLASVCQMLELHIPQARISTAADGSTALRLMQQRPFDLLILDYQLQTTTGSDLVRQLRAQAARTGHGLPPVVMMSSSPDVELFARALGVETFLPKPLLEESITDTLIPLLKRAGADLSARRPLLWSIRRR